MADVNQSDSLIYRIWKDISSKSYDELGICKPGDGHDNMEFNKDLDDKMHEIINRKDS